MDKLTNYKIRCRETFQYSQHLGPIMQALEENKPNLARVYMVDAIFDLQNVINQKIGPDEAELHNGRIESFINMNRCADQLIEILEDEPVTKTLYDLL